MPAKQPIRSIIVGASGYTGAELVRLLADHPLVEVVAFVSSSSVGELVETKLPVWRGKTAMTFSPLSALGDVAGDVVFFATPHAVAMSYAAALLAAGKVVIDLSADFRLIDVDSFNQWYGNHTASDLLSQALYGLTEVARPLLCQASLIACPGCYATAMSLALIPIVATTKITEPIIVDAKSGVSGAGRRNDRLDLLMAEMATNFKAYALAGHRHHPEVMQTLKRYSISDNLPSLVFIPHLLPLARGMHVNVYVTLPSANNEVNSVWSWLSHYWQGNPFIEVLSMGSVVQLSQVIGSNRAILSVHVLSERLILISVVLDNLLKGAAGQAVQNMNIRFGFRESMGLTGAINDFK